MQPLKGIGICVVVAGIAQLTQFIYAELNHRAADDQISSGLFTTQLGEHRCELLPDKSELCLNTKSSAHYRYSRYARNIELEAGEATFFVQKDKTRPFNVVSGGVLIQDVATSFLVYRKPSSTQVTILEGKARALAPLNPQARLEFNLAESDRAWSRAPAFHRLQQVEFDDATGTMHGPITLTEQRLSQLTAWRNGRIDLTDVTLQEALEEYARYQPIGRFKYADDSLARIRLGGDMEIVNLNDFLGAIEHTFNIHHSTDLDADGNTIITLSRPRSRQK